MKTTNVQLPHNKAINFTTAAGGLRRTSLCRLSRRYTMVFPMRSILNLALILLVLSADYSYSCTVMPSSGEPDWGEIAKEDSIRYLVKHSEIYLAESISKKTIYRNIAEFTFRVERTLRGSNRQSIKLEGGDLEFKKDFYKHSFHENVLMHAEPEFWSFQDDNGADFGDCINRGFYRVGTKYLIFLNEGSLRRSFEPIFSENDLWLKTIESTANFMNFMESYEKESEKP